MKIRAGAYGAGMCALTTAVTLVACSGSSASDPSQNPVVPSASVTTSSPTPGPSNIASGPVAPRYVLSAKSKLTVQLLGGAVSAHSGDLSITTVSGGATQINAVASSKARPNKKNKGGKRQPQWTLNLTVSPAGRALEGKVTINGHEFAVLPNTGSIGTVISAESAQIWTALAVTVVPGTNPTPEPGSQVNSPMTFLIEATSSNAPAPASPSASGSGT